MTINDLANLPENLAMHGLPPDTRLDFARITGPHDVTLGDDAGYILFQWLSPGVYRGHYVMNPASTGTERLAQARRLVNEMFTLHGAGVIIGEIPPENLASRWFTSRLGFTSLGASVDEKGRPCVKYTMSKSQWDSLEMR